MMSEASLLAGSDVEVGQAVPDGGSPTIVRHSLTYVTQGGGCQRHEPSCREDAGSPRRTAPSAA